MGTQGGVLLWADGPLPERADLSAWAEAVAEVCDVAAIFTPRQDALHLCRWPEGLLVDALRELQARGVQTRLTVWATSDLGRWTEQAGWLARVFEACAVGGVERPGLDLDVEGAWRGTATLEQIGAFAVRWRLEVSANYVPSLKLPSYVLALLRASFVGEITPQAYSQYNPAKRWTWDDLIRPRAFQRHALEQAAQVNAGRAVQARVRCGLMAALQQHPSPHPKGIAALDAAADEVRAQGVHLLGVWSFKHLVANPKGTAWAVDLKERLKKERLVA